MSNYDIDKFENLPQKESNKHLLYKGERWKWKRGELHKVNGEYPWKHVQRILKAYVGKHFDDAFSAYCKIVPDYQQKCFLEEFERDTRIYMSYWDEWIVDDDGIIRFKKGTRKKPKPSIQSSDFKTELRHKVTGHNKEDFEKETVAKKVTKYYYKYITRYTYGMSWRKTVPKHEWYSAKEEDFEPVVVSGWIKYYKSKNDREFKRLMAEKIKRANKRSPKKEFNEAEYRAILRAQVLKEREEARQKLEAKGMRPNAFTSNKTDQK
jgi:hypothetical protein